MSLSNALFASVSGLDTASTAISVIGDNISNVSTPAFKERRALFADLLGQNISTSGGVSQIGSGSKVLNVGQVFTQGTFESSANTTDLGIEGRGFFILDGQQGQTYSRAGLFNFDRDGLLVDALGQRVQGFTIDPATQTSTGQLADIQLNVTLADPQASTGIEVSMNLDSAAPTNGPFSLVDPSGTSSFQTSVTAYDSLGGGHEVTVYYTRTGPNAWTWNATIPPADSTVPPGAGETVVSIGAGTLAFDTAGNLSATTGGPLVANFTGGGALAQNVALDFGATGTTAVTTQFTGDGDDSTALSITQDGFATGNVSNLTIDREGFFVVSFTNGRTQALARAALATFPSVEGLTAVGNNLFVESRESGQPLIGAPETGQFGSVRSNAIEQSNVDLADQFIRLIINQRAFQANTRTVSTTNELLANLVQLGQ
ncbi:MAG: flagellar hook protein FlgE [Myxococcota bacterium]